VRSVRHDSATAPPSLSLSLCFPPSFPPSLPTYLPTVQVAQKPALCIDYLHRAPREGKGGGGAGNGIALFHVAAMRGA